jgi:hypothetical protein
MVEDDDEEENMNIFIHFLDFFNFNKKNYPMWIAISINLHEFKHILNVIQYGGTNN